MRNIIGYQYMNIKLVIIGTISIFPIMVLCCTASRLNTLMTSIKFRNTKFMVYGKIILYNKHKIEIVLCNFMHWTFPIKTSMKMIRSIFLQKFCINLCCNIPVMVNSTGIYFKYMIGFPDRKKLIEELSYDERGRKKDAGWFRSKKMTEICQ